MTRNKIIIACRQFRKPYVEYIVLIFSLVFFLQVFLGSLHKSLTWDEPSFISAGYSYLNYNDFRLNPSHPPLMQELEAFPLLFMNLEAPLQDDPVWNSENPVVSFGKKFIFYSGNNLCRITLFSRLPVMLIGTALIVLIFLWGRKLYATIPAIFASALASFSPNLIAHAKLATEDLGCTFFMFTAVWTFWMAVENGKTKSWIICGIVTGLALLTKFTALLLFPIYCCLALIICMKNRNLQQAWHFAVNLLIAVLIAFIVVGAGYNFSFDVSLYFRGISAIYSDASGVSYPVYFMGNVSERVHWFYNLAAFALKVPVPILILLLMAFITLFKDKELWHKSIFLLIPAFIIIFVSFFDRANLGLRRILPAFPFLFLFTAQIFFSQLEKFKPKNFYSFLLYCWKTIKQHRFATLLLCWTAISSLLIYPNHLAFFNIIAGGPQNGPCFFDDSNIDWGQDLPALAELQKAKYKGKPFKLAYFGTAVPKAYGVKTENFSFREIINPQPGIYAISVHNLVWFRKMKHKNGLDIDWLEKYKPTDYAGYSIYIYEFQ